MLNDDLHIELGNQIPLSNTETPSSPAIGSQLDPENPIINSSDNPGTTGDLESAHCPTTTETPSSPAITSQLDPANPITHNNNNNNTGTTGDSETANSQTMTVVQETLAERMDKLAMIFFPVFLGISVAIILAAITNMKKSAKNRGELILYKASAGCAIITFFADIRLLISILCKVSYGPAENVKIRTQLRLIAVAVISALAPVIVVAMNAVI